MIELRKIRHVLEIARQGGIAKAATSLNITQSALTRSIQILEDQLGLLIFERGPRGVRLTPEGERFVERGGRLLAEAEDMESFTRGVRTLEKGRIRLGAAPASFRILWQNALPTFIGRFPGIQVETVADSVDEVARMLVSGDLDFAIGSLEALKSHGDLQVEDIASVAVNPFVRLGHPLDNGTMPDLAALFSYPMAGPSAAEPHRAFFDRLSIDYKFPYAVPHLVIDSFSLTLRIVERTDAFSFVFSSYAASPEFQDKFLSWRGWTPFPPLPISLAYRKGWLPTHAAAPLLEILRETTKRLDTSQ